MHESAAAHINAAPEAAARDALQNCCAAPAWIEAMLARRPFADEAALAAAAAEVWWTLDREAWLQAFAAHPQIGDLDSLRAKFSATANWASAEQAGVAAADEETIRDLARYNREYLERFGYIFIVCATGKSAAQMLALLKDRLPNDAETELRVAAAEQLKITQLRLEKLST